VFRPFVLPLVLVLGAGPAAQAFCQSACLEVRSAAAVAACHGTHGVVLEPVDGAPCAKASLSDAIVPGTLRDGGASPEHRALLVSTASVAAPARSRHVVLQRPFAPPLDRHPLETPLRI
jgi:hypothetical protein